MTTISQVGRSTGTSAVSLSLRNVFIFSHLAHAYSEVDASNEVDKYCQIKTSVTGIIKYLNVCLKSGRSVSRACKAESQRYYRAGTVQIAMTDWHDLTKTCPDI